MFCRTCPPTVLMLTGAILNLLRGAAPFFRNGGSSQWHSGPEVDRRRKFQLGVKWDLGLLQWHILIFV